MLTDNYLSLAYENDEVDRQDAHYPCDILPSQIRYEVHICTAHLELVSIRQSHI